MKNSDVSHSILIKFEADLDLIDDIPDLIHSRLFVIVLAVSWHVPLFSSQALITMALNEQFEHAGKKPGLQVWRVEKLTLAPVPTEFYGDFYTGDSYIVLHTISTSPALYNIHSWLGSRFKCSAHLIPVTCRQ